jgi:hypothetical protein
MTYVYINFFVFISCVWWCFLKSELVSSVFYFFIQKHKKKSNLTYCIFKIFFSRASFKIQNPRVITL